MPDKTRDSEPPRVVIEQVTPVLEAGRYPIKRSVGSAIDVGAAIFKDGHDLIYAELVIQAPGDPATRQPLHYRYEPDRWHGAFTVDRPGRWRFTIEAWPDHFGTWRSELKKRLDAAQDLRPELLEGADLLARHARSQRGEIARRLEEAAAQLGNQHLSVDERLRTAFSDAIAELVRVPIDARDVTRLPAPLEILVDPVEATFSAWYELFPRSESPEPGRHGTFTDTLRRLPEIAALGFDVLYLPPIHPIGETHRKGKNNARSGEPGDVGSPWAIGSRFGGHTAVHPQLGTLEDFELLVKSAREFGIEIALDYALQCSPDHPWVREHPKWFFVRPDGSIRYAENPPKKYEDIYPLNFWCEDRQGLWQACLDILLFWIARGVRVFRVDNPHTKPFAFWEWALAEVNRRHPNVFFLSESFTRPNRMKALAKLGFNQSYSYFTWKNSAFEIKDYLSELTRGEMPEYFRPNFFANTPDILHEYLQVGGRPAFRIRLVLAATLSPSYGIYSGFELAENVPVRHGSEEYLDSEKYELKHRDYNTPNNIKPDIARLNRIRRENPALQRLDNLVFVHSEYEGILAYRKYAPGNEILVVVNLDPFRAHESIVHVPIEDMGIPDGEPYEVADLLSGARYGWRGRRNYVRLDPAERVAHVFRVSRRND